MFLLRSKFTPPFPESQTELSLVRWQRIYHCVSFFLLSLFSVSCSFPTDRPLIGTADSHLKFVIGPYLFSINAQLNRIRVAQFSKSVFFIRECTKTNNLALHNRKHMWRDHKAFLHLHQCQIGNF